MLRFAIVVATFVALAVQQSYAYNTPSCSNRTDKSLFAIETCIDEQRSMIEKLRKAAEHAWLIGATPSHVFELVDLSILRPGDSPFAARFQRLHRALRSSMYPSHHEGEDAFVLLRARYAEPTELRRLYESSKHSVLGKIASYAIKGMVADALSKSSHLFDQPLSLEAANAGTWYAYSCDDPRSMEYETSKHECAKVSTFPTRFKETYGVEPNSSSAYVMSWLYRRHMEGGPRLVAEWQRIAKDLAKEQGVESARPQIQ